MVRKKTITDSTLVSDYIQGKEAALGVLIKRHQAKIIQFYLQ